MQRAGGRAELYESIAKELERAGIAEIRAELAGDLRGRVLEVGCGTGLNFPHYPPEAEVTALEPVDEFRRFAEPRAVAARARIQICDGDAQALPFGDDSFDAVLSTLVLCSIPDATAALQEIRRVARPAAPVRFLEHVRSTRSGVAFAQEMLNPLWWRFMDGCNLNRRSVEQIEAAGFIIDSVREHDLPDWRGRLFPMRVIRTRR